MHRKVKHKFEEYDILIIKKLTVILDSISVSICVPISRSTFRSEHSSKRDPDRENKMQVSKLYIIINSVGDDAPYRNRIIALLFVLYAGFESTGPLEGSEKSGQIKIDK